MKAPLSPELSDASVASTGALSLFMDVAWVLGAGAVVCAGLIFGRLGVDLLPVSRARREGVARFYPAFAALTLFVYGLFATQSLFARYPSVLPFALLFVVAGFVAACWGSIRDFMAGVSLHAARAFRVGDQIRLGNVSGRVMRMGPRSLQLETPEGETAYVPYSVISRDSIIRAGDGASGETGVSRAHTFRMTRPSDSSIPATIDIVRRTVLGSHWASPCRDPEIIPLGSSELEITVFVLDLARAPDVEAAVRMNLEASTESESREIPA